MILSEKTQTAMVWTCLMFRRTCDSRR